MRKIKSVFIEGFWGDKTVSLKFDKNINFLIGVNGSGKTTIINIIAACLNADFTTLDKAQFSKVRIEFYSETKQLNDNTFIEVVKKENPDSPYPKIDFIIKLPHEAKSTTFKLNELEEEVLYRYHKDYNRFKNQLGRDINISLQSIITLTWLSIHRTSRSNNLLHLEEKSFESSIDQKVKELSSELVKYFGVLDKRYSLETEKFQKNIFLALIEEIPLNLLFQLDDLETEKEKESLKQIFLLFKLQEHEFEKKLNTYFKHFDSAKKNVSTGKSIDLDQYTYVLGTRRVHLIVQEWGLLNEMKNRINKPKLTFIEELNKLYQKKELIINEKNELIIKTQSGKDFSLTNLSSGEKQLFIILGESLLKENMPHIYIADEPELSLHVDWQEKLVESLRNVNYNSQIIFATHSPDIVGPFSDYVIKVEEFIK